MQNQLVVTEKRDLALIGIGNVLGVKPATLAKNLDKLMPNPVTQALYLKYAGDFKLNVQDGAKMLELIVAPYNLHQDDDVWVSVGENLVVNKVVGVERHLLVALELIGEVERDYSGVIVTRPTATALAMVLKDNAQRIIYDLACYSGDLRELFKISDSAEDEEVLMVTIRAVVRTVWQLIDDREVLFSNAQEFLDCWEQMDKTDRMQIKKAIGWEHLRERYDF